jgi:Peptidase family M1 domain
MALPQAISRLPWSFVGRSALCVLMGAAPVAAQMSAPGVGGSASTGEVSYEQRYNELQDLDAVSDGVAPVQGLTLTRDAGRFRFDQGSFYRLAPIGGRTVGAVFLGSGVFSLIPPNLIERERLSRFQKSDSLEAPFSSLVLLFADSTPAELEAKLHFARGIIPAEVRQRFKASLGYLGDEDSKSIDPDLMSALLNGESSGMFYAAVGRSSGAPLVFVINPHEVEGVSLWQRVRRYGWTRTSEVICRFAPGGATPAGVSGDRTQQADIRRYQLNTSLTPSGGGDLNFATDAKIEITSAASIGPWIAFTLFEKLKVDSARWETGAAAPFFKGKDGDLLWVRLDQPLEPGQVRTLSLSYHGDLIDRVDDFFFIKSSADWYPRSLEGRGLATFDLTYRTPKGQLFASVGDQVDSSTVGQVTTSHWVANEPIRNASFNLGFFKDYEVREQGIPPVTVLVAEGAHRHLGGLRQKNMKETVGGDVAKSLRFFQYVYGPAPAKRMFATEIPYAHGEAFPGLIHLSWWTFQQTDRQGEDEVFRAHEVAHQWWGIGVDFGSYHDQWLSEGFADFSGLWYLQTVRKDSDKYFAVLDRWKNEILTNRDERAPIWLGYRTASSKDSTGYDVVIYKKGAWVLHMLRIMMLDLKTMNEDRFTDTMRDFYATYRGKRASTADFRRVAERHAGVDLGWFFDQWVSGTAVPSYRVAYRTQAADGGKYRVTLRVQQDNVPADFRMYVPVAIDLGNNQTARVRVKVQGSSTDVDLPLLPGKPKAVRFNDLSGVLGDVKMVDWHD